MTFSDLGNHSPIIASLLRCNFSYGCAAADKSSTDRKRRAVPLQQLSLLLRHTVDSNNSIGHCVHSPPKSPPQSHWNVEPAVFGRGKVVPFSDSIVYCFWYMYSYLQFGSDKSWLLIFYFSHIAERVSLFFSFHQCTLVYMCKIL